MDNANYWNPILETLPREKLRTLQLKKFQRIFQWAYEHSKFYNKLYTDAGIEPGGSIPATRQRMEGLWGAKVYDQCGSTEIITGPGRQGRLVATSLDRLAQPCIRFDAKDIIQWSAEPCECGRTFRHLDGGIIGRSDDIMKVKGVLWAPSAVEDVVHGVDQLSDKYQIILYSKGDADQITLKVELLPEYETDKETIKQQVLSQLRLKTNLNYILEVHKYGSLPRFEGKGKRFQDLRKK